MESLGFSRACPGCLGLGDQCTYCQGLGGATVEGYDVEVEIFLDNGDVVIRSQEEGGREQRILFRSGGGESPREFVKRIYAPHE